jgi:hypothetical protein
VTAEEKAKEAEVIKARQRACDKHVRGRKPYDCFIGKSPPTCAFCGITKAEYEKENPA